MMAYIIMKALLQYLLTFLWGLGSFITIHHYSSLFIIHYSLLLLEKAISWGKGMGKGRESASQIKQEDSCQEDFG